MDMSPLGCGYTWSQSGHAEMSCKDSGVMSKDDKVALAREDAWRIARERCPEECPPVEMKDTASPNDREHLGTCYSGMTYYPQRILFQCRGI